MCATDNFRQINHITNILKQALSDNEPPRQRLLRLLFRDFRQNPLQVLHIIVLIPSDRTPRDLEAFLDRIVHRFIRNDDISSFRESRNNTRYGRKGLSVNNASRRPQKCSDICLDLHVYILRAVEAWRTARPNAVCTKGLYSSLFQILIRVQIVVIVRREVSDSSAI